MTDDPWHVDRLDLAGYLARVGVAEQPPTREALDELHEAHVRAFSFDNVDVLLGQHPGVSLEAVQEKFVGRGRGGYCFEHATLFAAVLQRLGYDVRRHLGRVGDPAAGPVQGRTHMSVEVRLDGQRLLCDPGFGMSLRRPVPLADGAEDRQLVGYRVRLDDEGAWQLLRERHDGWDVTHTIDELPVLPADVVVGHHYTSTFPTSHFRHGLMVTKHLADSHVSVTAGTVTIRRAGEPTEHRELRTGELDEWLDRLEVGLTPEERGRLAARLAEIAAG